MNSLVGAPEPLPPVAAADQPLPAEPEGWPSDPSPMSGTGHLPVVGTWAFWTTNVFTVLVFTIMALGEFAAHEQQLLAGMAPHEAVIGARIGREQSNLTCVIGLEARDHMLDVMGQRPFLQVEIEIGLDFHALEEMVHLVAAMGQEIIDYRAQRAGGAILDLLGSARVREHVVEEGHRVAFAAGDHAQAEPDREAVLFTGL